MEGWSTLFELGSNIAAGIIAGIVIEKTTGPWFDRKGQQLRDWVKRRMER